MLYVVLALLLIAAALTVCAHALQEMTSLMASGMLRGPAGRTGHTGPQGEPGERGSQGPRGECVETAPAAAPSSAPSGGQPVRVMNHTHQGWKPAGWVREGTPAYDAALREHGKAILLSNGEVLQGDKS